MFRLGFAASAAALALAACTPVQSISQPPLDVTYTGSPKISQIAGTNPVKVRTYRKGGQGTPRAEITGARCDLKGQGFEASFTTPAIVNLPDLLAETRPVTVTCAYNGETSAEIKQPYNITAAAVSSGATGQGIVGAIAVGVVNASRDKTRDHYGYTPISVSF